MINGIPRRVWSTVAIFRPLDAAYHTREHPATADVSLLDRVHPRVGVRVALAVSLAGEVDRHLETLAIGGEPGNLFADVVSHTVVGQLWETALASSCHPVWGPATAYTTTTDAVGVQHVGECLGGVGLDVTSQSATSSEAKSPCDARQAEKQDQLESHLAEIFAIMENVIECQNLNPKVVFGCRIQRDWKWSFLKMAFFVLCYMTLLLCK